MQSIHLINKNTFCYYNKIKNLLYILMFFLCIYIIYLFYVIPQFIICIKVISLFNFIHYIKLQISCAMLLIYFKILKLISAFFMKSVLYITSTCSVRTLPQLKTKKLYLNRRCIFHREFDMSKYNLRATLNSLLST